MAELESTRPAARGDRGFTLIEVLIVTVMIGIVAAALGAVVTVVLRNAPSTEVRVDDARTVQGLVTWLPEDIDAAPPDGFYRGVSSDPSTYAYWPCGGPAPADSYNVLTASWTETTSSITRFAASYRYELVGNQWRMVRYTCDDAGGSMSTGESINLTAGLNEWDISNPPVEVAMCTSAVTAGAACPSGDEVPANVPNPTEVRSLKLYIDRPDGVVALIDAAPKNPDQDLSDDTKASFNNPPKLSAGSNYVFEMYAGETRQIDVIATHGAYDPDGPSDPLSVAVDYSVGLPPGVMALAQDPTFVDITTDPTLPVGTIGKKLDLVVADSNAGWVAATVEVKIIPRPIGTPTASTLSYPITIARGDTLHFNTAATHRITDPEGDPMSILAILNHPGSMVTNPPKANVPDPMFIEVKAPGSAPLGPTTLPIQFTVWDSTGELLASTLDMPVTIVDSDPNSAPIAATNTNIDVILEPGGEIDIDLAEVFGHGVTDPDGDAIWIYDVNDPSGITTTTNGVMKATIAADITMGIGPAGPVTFKVEDPHGESVEVTVTVEIVPVAPPASTCVLGSLSGPTSPIERQGSGAQAHPFKDDVTITLTYSGSCDGLTLQYDTGDTTGLGIAGRVFPSGSNTTSITIVGKNNGGTEKWLPGTFVLTASTTSAVLPNQITTTITVN